MIWMDADIAVTVPCNQVPLVDATDGKTLEIAIAYNEAGMNLSWNFVTTAGVMTTTAVTPTTAGLHDWLESGTDEGMYKIEIPASGGTINNDTEGSGWISGTTTSCLPFAGPIIGFRAAALNNAYIDGGDLPDVNVTHVADTAQTGNDNGADINTLITQVGTAGDGLTAINLPNQTMDIAGDITGNLSGSVGSVTGHTNQTGDGYAIVNNGTHGNAALETLVDELESRLTAARAGYLDELAAANIPTDLTNIETDTKRLFDVTGCGDADAPVAGSLAESIRWIRHFVKNTWELTEVPTPDELSIKKDDGTTESFKFEVYTSASVNYRKIP